ncbi:MAG: hypothetical protein QXE09_03605 [Thermoproteus sp.]
MAVKYMAARSHGPGCLRPALQFIRSGGWASLSLVSSASSQAFSSWVSHPASLGRSGMAKRTTRPQRTAGIPSMMKTQRHPARPSQFCVNSQPDSGDWTTFATARALMKRPTALALSSWRNQWVRYTIMPGKKEASARPSTNLAI